MSAGKCFTTYLSSGLPMDFGNRGGENFDIERMNGQRQRVPETCPLKSMFLLPRPELIYQTM